MKWEVYCEYSTGDSFQNYDTTDTLAPTWENLDKAKLALVPLKEHHNWYDEKSGHNWRLSEEEIAKTANAKNEPWWFPDSECLFSGISDDSYERQASLMLGMDDGSSIRVSVPYQF